jgi:hypothetical protein
MQTLFTDVQESLRSVNPRRRGRVMDRRHPARAADLAVGCHTNALCAQDGWKRVRLLSTASGCDRALIPQAFRTADGGVNLVRNAAVVVAVDGVRNSIQVVHRDECAGLVLLEHVF